MSEKILEVKHLGKAFGSNQVLRDIDFSVSPGDVTCIIGPSGSGKSTLLRCLNMLETPSTGEINYHGTDITSKNVNVPECRSKVGMVFQNFNLFNNMTALKNCTVGQVKVLKKSKEEAEKKAKELLKNTNMKVAQISEKVGFANVSYFCRSFREYYGCSPESYRKGTGEDEEAVSDH